MDKKDYHAEYQKEKRAKALAEGRCTQCFKEPAVPGFRRCARCIQKWSAYAAKYYKTPQGNTKCRAIRRNRYYKLKSSGVCVACAKAPAEAGKTMCADCLKKMAARIREKKDRR